MIITGNDNIHSQSLEVNKNCKKKKKMMKMMMKGDDEEEEKHYHVTTCETSLNHFLINMLIMLFKVRLQCCTILVQHSFSSFPFILVKHQQMNGKEDPERVETKF